MRFILLALLLGLGLAQVKAQHSGIIKGKLVDSSGKQSLSLATVTVFRAVDTTIITYRLSDGQGQFRVPGLPLSVPCRVVISFSGYHVERKDFTLTGEKPELDLGIITMTNTAESLDEVLVTAERPPVIFRKDTVEFNASAFKTLPTALVEDLLKKFPGIDIDKDGNMTYNGRVVNRMMVDGKDFFGGDPKVANRNLPANIIDKVQVTEDQDQLNENPDINKSKLGLVVNLKLKRSIKKGWFGKAYAGGGTDDRYEAGSIVNLFRDTLQVSLIGYTNNLNRSGFQMGDILTTGGFNRSGYNSISLNSDGGFALNDISFGGLGSGIVRSTGAGTNVNTELNKKTTLNFQYFYGQNNTKLNQLTNVQQFIGDTTFTTRSNSNQVTDDYSHRLGTSLRWRPDASTTVRFDPLLTVKKTSADKLLFTEAYNNFEPKLNESNNDQRVRNNELGYSHSFSYNKNFKKKGRSLFISQRLNIAGSDKNQYNDIVDSFYKASPSFDNLNQLRNRDGSNFSANLNVNYNEPLSKSFGLRLSNTVEYFRDKDNLTTYNREQSGGDYDVPNDDLSNGLTRSGIRNTSNASLKYTIKKWTITPGLSVQALNIDNRFTKVPDVDQHFLYVLPTLNISVNEWNFSYNINIREPQASDLQPVPDNTNTLYQQLGNTSLVPTKSHNIYLNYYKYNTKSLTNYSVYVNGNIDENAIVRERTVDENGVQTTRPINVDGKWQFTSNASISKQFKLRNKWQLTLRGSTYGTYNRDFVIVNGIRSKVINYRVNPYASVGFNWNDKFELNERYSYSWSKSNYENEAYSDIKVVSHYSTSELIVRYPKHWVWESTLDYIYNPQASEGVRKSNLRWNAGVNFLFLKEDKGQFKLSVYDLLNQNISISRTTKENYIQDVQTTVLQRYFLLTFTYNIRSFGGSNKVGGRDKLFLF